MTALYLVAVGGSVEVVKLLMEAGADVNAVGGDVSVEVLIPLKFNIIIIIILIYK